VTDSPDAAGTLVLGLGNPVLGDDGVGCRVATELLNSTDLRGAEVDTFEKGGLSLMERILGYRRVILVDAVTTGTLPRGTVRVFPLGELPNPGAGHLNSAHETSLQTALDVARQLKAAVPEEITVVAVETERVFDLGEELSQEVTAALPNAVAAVRALVLDRPVR
jgi:hydrogenase maturation protease